MFASMKKQHQENSILRVYDQSLVVCLTVCEFGFVNHLLVMLVYSLHSLTLNTVLMFYANKMFYTVRLYMAMMNAEGPS